MESCGIKNKKRNKNKGFSLVEVVVVIAIMAVLVGLLVPQFMKIARERRMEACRKNREELLKVYERVAYDTATDIGVDQTGLESVMNGTFTPVKSEIDQYLDCPNGGTGFTYTIDGNKAIIHCGKCDNDVAVTMEKWKK